MSVYIESRRLPLVREAHAARQLARGCMDSAALRTIITGLIALVIVAGVIGTYWRSGSVDPALAFALGAVITFYFTDPKQPAYGAPAHGEGGRDGNP